MSNNKNIIVFGGFVLLAALFIFFQSRNNDPQNVVDINSDSIQLAEGELEILPEDVTETTLTDVSGGNSTGTAMIVRKNGQLVHSVTANLPDPGEGNVYEGWLVQPEPLMFISTGVMQQELEGVYSLSFSADEEYSGYNRVVITLESEVDETPEDHVLEGEFN